MTSATHHHSANVNYELESTIMALLLLLKPLPSYLSLLFLLFCISSENQAFQSNPLPVFSGAPARRCNSASFYRRHCRTSHLRIRVILDDERKEELMEEENPQADLDKTSLSGVRYGSVFDSLFILYPPTDLEKRNAVSRSDGYWPFINSGKEPPKQLTYGEFDLYFFAQLLDQALDYYKEHQDDNDRIDTWNGKVFTDIGSGTGRLVFAAAALHPEWKLCRGLEVLEGIHKVAVETLETCRHEVDLGTDTSPGDEMSDHKENNARSTAWKAFATPFDAVQQQHGDDWLDMLKQEYESDDKAPPQEEESSLDSDAESKHTTTSTAIDNESTSLNEKDDIAPDQDSTDNNGSFDMYVLPTNQDTDDDDDDDDEMLCLAPIEFTCGSFEDPYEYIGDSDLIFVFSSCMSDTMMTSLGKAIGRQCKPGTIVITTDYSLPLTGEIEPLEDDESMPFGSYELYLLESIDGWCWLTGGRSTAHIHRVVSSLWEDYGVERRQKPEISLQEQALRVVQAYEAGELTDTDKFLRDVRNNMIFIGLPESWLPAIDNGDNGD